MTGAPGTGKTTTASAVAKESDLEKSVHMHTDDFYHYHVRKPSAREYDYTPTLKTTLKKLFSGI
ncbi:zeta toxin family protein [Campylobacter jejuni]|uniref:zeta toxin family protein n=1 Tax=Campylobacter jejuni TaxID=197 RepID=UPI003EFB5502